MDAIKYIRRCLTALVFREMQIKDTRYHFISIRKVRIKKTQLWVLKGCGESRALILWWRKCKMVQPHCTTVSQFLKMGNGVTTWPGNSVSVYNLKWNENLCLHHVYDGQLRPRLASSLLHQNFYTNAPSSIIHNRQQQKQSNVHPLMNR